MRPHTRWKAAVVAASLLTAFVVSTESSPAHALLPDKLVVLAGSPHHLAYADYPVPRKGAPDYAHGELHVLSSNGADRNYGTGFVNADPASPDAYSFSIVGSTLTANSAADPSQVQWWDVSGAGRGTGTLPAGARWQGAAPGGWLLIEADRATVAVESTTGSLTSFGQPVSSEADPGGVGVALSGTRGVVTIGSAATSATYQRWQSPEVVQALDLGASAGSAGLSCDDVSTTILGCVDRGADGTGTAQLAVPLTGGPATVYAGCGADSTAVGKQLVWVCGNRHAHPRFGVGGSSHKSRNWVTPLPGVSALGGFVTGGHRQHTLVSIPNGRRAAHVIVSIPSPLVRLNDTALREAAAAVEAQALRSGALDEPAAYPFPAQVLQASSDALIRAAIAKNPNRRPADTRSVMGRVPRAIAHRTAHPRHRHIKATRALRGFRHPVRAGRSGGIGLRAHHGGNLPAPFQRPDGVYVDPRLPTPADPTIGMIAIRAALQKLGQPYVWAAGGPSTFDCSGLTQWAYAHAGIHLIHYTGSQWNEGRLLKPRQILPGDLVLFAHRHGPIHHVGIYLGAGWMVNAPFTSQYVSVVRVPLGVAGVVRP
jgi:cell wall-associated NlpC family hydrolase